MIPSQTPTLEAKPTTEQPSRSKGRAVVAIAGAGALVGGLGVGVNAVMDAVTPDDNHPVDPNKQVMLTDGVVRSLPENHQDLQVVVKGTEVVVNSQTTTTTSPTE